LEEKSNSKVLWFVNILVLFGVHRAVPTKTQLAGEK
jgi:hypothetical protein